MSCRIQIYAKKRREETNISSSARDPVRDAISIFLGNGLLERSSPTPEGKHPSGADVLVRGNDISASQVLSLLYAIIGFAAGGDDAGDKCNLAEAISHVKFRGHDRTEGKETPSSSRFLLFFSPLINSPIRLAAKHELVTPRRQFLLSPRTVSNAFLLTLYPGSNVNQAIWPPGS